MSESEKYDATMAWFLWIAYGAATVFVGIAEVVGLVEFPWLFYAWGLTACATGWVIRHRSVSKENKS